MRYIPEEKLRALHAEVDGFCGLYISVPEAGEVLALDSHKPVSAASTIKVPLLALLLKDGESGRLDLNAPVPMTAENRVGGSGVIKSLGEFTMSLWDYAVLMTIISDNSATNMVFDAVGIDRANAFFAEQGWNETHVAAKLYFPRAFLPDGTQDYNKTSAADLGDMMERMLAGTLVSPTVSRQMMQIMAAQQLGRFSPVMPVQRYADTRKPLPAKAEEGRVIMCNKTGTLTDNPTAHDTAAIILPDGKKATITVLTRTSDNAKAESIMKQMARTLYEGLTNN